MEEMKTFECAVCGKIHKTIEARSACEITCLAEQEKMQKQLDEDTKKKAKKEAQDKIDREIIAWVEQYNKLINMIKEFNEKFDEQEDNAFLPPKNAFSKSIFDLIF